MVRDIVIYPDKRLKLISKDVTSFDSELHTLLDDMYDTMISKKGVGLAAIQIGVPLRALIINMPDDDSDEQTKENTLEIINPIFVEKSGKEKHQEGCLSIPGIYEDIERAKYVKIEYQDRFGERYTIEDDDFLAVAIQHEVEHLDGKVFIEKLSFIKRKKFEKEWKKRYKNTL